MATPAVTSVLQTIGNTPVVKLAAVVPPECAGVFLKIEGGNPTGSYKDRFALAMIEGAERRGDLRPGQPVVEYSGGSTGSSLAFVCAVKGYPLTVVTSDAFAPAKLQTMRAFGATLVVIPSQGGKITPDLVPSMIEEAKRISRDEGAYWTDQFNNPDLPTGYRAIGRELLEQVPGRIDAFCASVGTAGMLTGATQVLRDANPALKVVVLEPASAPLISQGRKGTHSVDGIAVGIRPPILSDNLFDEARGIEEAEARVMANRLAREEGVFAGTSTGMNVVGAIQLARELGPGHTVVTVAVDTGLKYLQTDLYEGF
jgi:cysteine synthase A